jgi:hypothetical protein
MSTTRNRIDTSLIPKGTLEQIVRDASFQPRVDGFS